MSVIKLVPPATADSKYRDDVIQHLEAALERAKSGETVSIAIVEVTRDDGSYAHWSHLTNVNAMLGACWLLAHKIGNLAAAADG